MKRFKLYLTLAITLLVLSGCVSKKKYQQMSTLKGNAQSMLDKRNKELETLKDEVAKERAKLNECDEARRGLEGDTTRLGAKLRNSSKEMVSMKASCDRLDANYQQLKSRSTEKMRELVDQLENLQGNLTNVQSDLAQREARLAEVEGRLRQRDSLMNSLRTRLADALLGFQKDGLTVEIKNGKVYVSLSNKLLFASGSTEIDENGQRALTDLAGILKDQADITIMVEGHTDDVPVSNLGRIKDNWDLSVMRSTEVVRLLVLNGVPSTRVIPSGRGENIPKIVGKTTEARASNRRTEIIISPKLDALYDLIGSK